MTILARTPNDMMPDNPIAGFIKTSDGANIRYARWQAVLRPCKGTVLLLHGRAENIEKMFETVADLQNKGFDVLTFDWRGQGGSSRMLRDKRRGFIDSFDQYIDDLDSIMDKVALPDCPGPYYILAHSTGALTALLAAPGFGNRIRRMVLCAPLLQLGDYGFSQTTLKYYTGLLSTIGLGSTYIAGGPYPQESRPFLGNKLTTDPDRFNQSREFAKAHPELTIGGPTASWLYAAIKAMERLQDPEYYGRITIPTLLIIAGADQVVHPKAIEQLGLRLRSGSALTIDGARHEMLHERDNYREQVLAAFATFVPGTEIV